MKSLIVLSVLLVVALADEVHHEDHHGLKAARKTCQADPATHIDDSVFEDLKKHGEKAVLPANFDKHILCLAKQLTLVTSEGKANTEGIKTHVGHVVHEADKIDTITKECAVDHATEEETASKIWKCLYKNHVIGHHEHHGSSDESGSHESGEHHAHHH